MNDDTKELIFSILKWVAIIIIVIVGYTIYWILTNEPPPPRASVRGHRRPEGARGG